MCQCADVPYKITCTSAHWHIRHLMIISSIFSCSINAFNTSPRPELTNDPYMVIAVVAVADGTQSTKALNVGTEGCIVNISTQTGTGVSESVTFISGVICIKDTIGDGFKLVKYRRTGTE